MLEEFGYRHGRAIYQDSFRDRRPEEASRPIGKVAAQVVEDVGHRALAHWLGQAAKADSNEEREAALEIAREIARLAGIRHADFIGRSAA
jgi:hypothetical protein